MARGKTAGLPVPVKWFKPRRTVQYGPPIGRGAIRPLKKRSAGQAPAMPWNSQLLCPFSRSPEDGWASKDRRWPAFRLILTDTCQRRLSSWRLLSGGETEFSPVRKHCRVANPRRAVFLVVSLVSFNLHVSRPPTRKLTIRREKENAAGPSSYIRLKPVTPGRASAISRVTIFFGDFVSAV